MVWRAKASGFELKCKSELYDILYHLRKEFELGYISKSDSEIIKPAIDYIHQEYTNDNICIAYLAQRCGISETYFRRVFQKTFATSPLKYINQLKISRAKKLISSAMLRWQSFPAFMTSVISAVNLKRQWAYVHLNINRLLSVDKSLSLYFFYHGTGFDTIIGKDIYRHGVNPFTADHNGYCRRTAHRCRSK